MGSKAFLVLGVLLAVVIAISTEVAARELAAENASAEKKSEFDTTHVFSFHLFSAMVWIKHFIHDISLLQPT